MAVEEIGVSYKPTAITDGGSSNGAAVFVFF
jgi:hypothetical protein